MGPQAIDWSAVWRGDTSGVSAYVADFLEVVATEGSGRGVRTAAAVEAGELLLAEQAVATAAEPRLAEVLVSLQEALDATTRLRLGLMFDGQPSPPPLKPVALQRWPGQAAGTAPAFGPECGLIPLARMCRIVKLNAYRCSTPIGEYAFAADTEAQPSDTKRHETYGVFPLASLVNHSCAANISKVLLADWVFLRAARDLFPGEELTQFYCDVRMPRNMRQKELLDLFGFHCACQRCLFEEELERCRGDLLAPLTSLYSCQVPGCHSRHGPVQVSQLEGLVEQAELSALAALEVHRSDKGREAYREAEQWLIWPLVPGLSQLAQRLRLDGRLSESVARWRRAEAAARSVVPLSNLHLRTLAELLLTEAQRGQAASLQEALAASLCATRLAYGGGVAVWQRLIGHRMPAPVTALVDQAAIALAPAQTIPITPSWGIIELDSVSGGRRVTLTLQSPAFLQLEDICLDASERRLLVRAPGAEDLQVECPFDVSLERLQPRFLRRRHSLVLSVLEHLPT